MISFTVRTNPLPKQRPRFTGGGHAYTPKRTREYEKIVRDVAALAMGTAKPLDGVINVSIVCYRGDRRRVDCDNLAKGITDACNGIVWNDDSQIRELCVTKEYDPKNPRAEVFAKVVG